MIGGSSSLRGRGPMALYWEQLYELRGRLVHGGRAITAAETRGAFDGDEQLWEFARSLE